MSLLVVVDGDDTLWETERLYDEARQDARTLVETFGFDGDVWEQIQRAVDQERVASLGFSPERFPGSCRIAYEDVAGNAATSEEAALVHDAASSPFERPAPLYDETRSAMADIRELADVLVLFTKGDQGVQQKRISDSGLAYLFDAIVITARKKAEDFSSFQQLYPSHCRAFSIGNSLRSDIRPAVEGGYSGLWLDRHVWEHERSASVSVDPLGPGITEIGNLAEAVDHLRAPVETGNHEPE